MKNTIRHTIIFLLGSPLLFFTAVHCYAKQANTLTIPIHIYIVENLDITVNQKALKNWISNDALHNQVLPEVNRIWAQANIQFSISSIENLRIENTKNTLKLTNQIANATRDSAGKADPERTKALNKLVKPRSTRRGTIAVYLVPFLGENSQGNAKRKKRMIYIAQWTNKNQSSSLTPRKFELIEHGAYSKGSFSRTLAHEIGHVLGLKHPNKNKQAKFNRLMGGKKKGDRLIRSEIKTARKATKSILKNH